MSQKRSYEEALHAMQAGVGVMSQREPNGECSPKHLRVGVNSAMCSQAAVVSLLIEKGVFTLEEYAAELLAEVEREVERYEKRVDPTGRVHLV